MIRLCGLALLLPLAAPAAPLWQVAVGKDAGATFLAPVGDTVVVATWTSDLVGLDAASGKRGRKTLRPVVSSCVFVDSRCAAEFAGRDH